jgi:hypothetical protein
MATDGYLRREASRKAWRGEQRRSGVAKGKRTSLAVRALALLFALALAALAARLWLGEAPKDTSATPGPADEAELDQTPPLHGEHSAKDQEALRGILRGAEGEAP